MATPVQAADVSGAEPPTFAEAWARAVRDHGDDPFLRFEGSTGQVDAWTYDEFDAVVDRVAATLQRNHVQPGDAVHLALTNSVTFVAVWLAATRLGAWIVPSDPMSRSVELEHHRSMTRPVIGFCARARASVYRRGAPGSMAVFEVDEDDTALAWATGSLGPMPQPKATDRAAVMFTSGTTGRPKGVEISQANYAFAGKTMAAAASLSPADRHIVVLPMFHANAQYYSFASAIHVGASVALMHRFSASGFLGQCVRHRSTVASLFAAPIRMILARGEPTPGVALRHCWYAQNIANDQYETIARWFGCRPRQLYGMTETIPAVLTDRADAPRADAMGYVTDGCAVDLVDATGQPVAVGEIGEIVVAGVPGLTLFTGYLDQPEVTAASFRNGWFHTGDRARRDVDGRFFFDGRRSDVLKVAGENVSTVEVESVLSAHPDVLEASVIGAPDEIRDEVPVAFVVAADAANPPAVDVLFAWCNERLAAVKVPRQISLLTELPRTSVGKIQKFKLADAVGEQSTAPA